MERLFYAPRFERNLGQWVVVQRRVEEWWSRFLRVTYNAALGGALFREFKVRGCPTPCPVLRSPPVITSELGEPDPDTGEVDGRIEVVLECAFFRSSPWEVIESSGVSIAIQSEAKTPICLPVPRPGKLVVCGYAEASQRLRKAKMEELLKPAILEHGEKHKGDLKCDAPCTTKYLPPYPERAPHHTPSPFGLPGDSGSSLSMCFRWDVECARPRQGGGRVAPPGAMRERAQGPAPSRASVGLEPPSPFLEPLARANDLIGAEWGPSWTIQSMLNLEDGAVQAELARGIAEQF